MPNLRRTSDGFHRCWRVVAALVYLVTVSGCSPTGISSVPAFTATSTATPVPTQTLIPTATSTPSATPGPGLDELMGTPLAHYANAELDAAIAEYQRLAELYPDRAEPLLGLAAVAQRQYDPTLALEYLEAAANADPTSTEALRLWAVQLEALRKYAEVVEVYDRMAALTPGDPNAHIARAMAYARIGNADEAVASLRTAQALDPDREYAWITVAGAASGARQYEAAIAIAGQGLAAYPDSTSLLMELGLARLSRGEEEAALSAFEKAVTLNPGLYAAKYWQGRVLLALGLFDEAAIALKQAADLGVLAGVDGVNLSYESMAYAADALARSDTAAAFAYLRDQVVNYGSRDALLMGYGLVRWRQGNIKLALDYMDNLVDADYIPALYWRAAIRAEQGDRDSAIADLHAFLAVRFSGPDVEMARDLLQSLGGDPDQAP